MNECKEIQVFDASAKSPQGLLFGSSYHLGNFDECMDIDGTGDAMDVIRTGRGESLRWAVCVPSACDSRSVARFVGVINNVKKILSTKQNNGLGLECIAGIKALAMIFIIAGHACLFIGSGPVMDAKAWDRLIQEPTNAFMLSNSLLVDTFLFLSAFLFSRLLLIEVTPAYFVVIFFYMTWLPKLGEGPLWKDRLQLEQERCMDSWWTNLLYVNNYVRTDRLMFFVAPLFIYALWHWRRFGAVFTAIATIISLVIPSVITFRNHLDPTILYYAKEFTDFAKNSYFVEAYMPTHMKMTPYFMGILTGYILHRIQSENYTFSNILKIFGWSTSIILGTVTTFSVSLFYQDWYQYSAWEASAYISLHKFAWSIATGWLIIACATGNGGILGKLLSWRFLVPIAKLTFCAYLVNGIIELYYVGQLRHPLHITFFTIVTRPVLSDNAQRTSSDELSRNTSQSKLDT
ncbi:unnamed protein product [Leptidea sinapis]|uniref:Acyltransferase 3 domain-containing protein n=1 Tax=Leptidea sinapis TaxID=189913 RepID=A0A5E4Q1V4_9NEOP|nr:unnamed protein product [Leptidea sinapis]